MVVLSMAVGVLALALIALGRGDDIPPAGTVAAAPSAADASALERRTGPGTAVLPSSGSERVEHVLVDLRPTRVRGRVIWPDGVPAYGASVAHDHRGLGIDVPTPFRGARAGMDGSFELEVPRGVQSLFASSGGVRSETLHIDTRRGQELAVTLMLARLPRLRGIVADSYGRPVNGQVRVVSRAGSDSEDGLTKRRERREFVGVSRDGDFRRDLPMDSHLTVRAWADGHAPSQVVEVAPGDTADDLRLVAPLLVDFPLRVVDPAGGARQGLAVGFFDPLFEQRSDAGIRWSEPTDAAGWTLLRSAPAQADRELVVRLATKSGFHPSFVVDTRVPRSTLVIADEALVPAVVEVVLTDAGGGLPLAGTLIVEEIGGTGRRSESFGGPLPEVRFDDLLPGARYGFKVMTRPAARPNPKHGSAAAPAPRPPSVPAAPLAYIERELVRGAQRLEIPMEALSRLRVEVRGSDGQPQFGAKVSIEGPVAYRPTKEFTDGNGRVIFTGLLRGEHWLTALDRRHVFIARQSVTVGPGADQMLILQAGR